MGLVVVNDAGLLRAGFTKWKAVAHCLVSVVTEKTCRHVT
jgi:hypothetical protein